MSRTLITGLVFSVVMIFAAIVISQAVMYPGYSNVAQAAEVSETEVVAEGLESHESELQKLLIERKKVLTRIVQSMKIFLEAGRVSIDEYRDANIALLRAEMDLCRTRNERIDILQKMVQFHTTCEDYVERRAGEGRATRIDVDRAKVARLEAQIELIRESGHTFTNTMSQGRSIQNPCFY